MTSGRAIQRKEAGRSVRLAAYCLLMTAAPLFAFDLKNLDLDKVASGAEKALKAARGLSDEEERAIGREVAANLAARYGLVEKPELVRYVNLIGQALVPHCSRPDIPYRFAILDSSQVNAFAAPGGYIFITRGILETAQNEGELAGVLAHEIGHVAHRHIAREIRKSNAIGAGVDLTQAAAKDNEVLNQVSDMSIDLLFKGLSREDEREADQTGTRLIAALGYQPRALKSLLQTLTARKPDDKSLFVLTKTHPKPEDRIRSIDAFLNTSSLAPTGVLNEDRFASFVKSDR